MEDRLDSTVRGNRAQRRAANRGKKAAALGSGLVLAAGAATTAATLASTAPAGANTPLVVDSLTDDGTGFTLREAIEQANTDAGQDTITFSVTGTITLESDLPNIDDALQIQGPGAALLTVDGQDQYEIFNFYDISSADGVNEVSGITLTHGRASYAENNNDGSGGAIHVRLGSADMTIANAVITENYAENDGGGVQFYDSTGLALITGTTISNNTALYGGGGLYADASDHDLTLTIVDSTVTGNTSGTNGGGLYLYGVDTTITNSTINFNQTLGTTEFGDPGDGGGVFAYRSTLAVSGSFIGNNDANNGGGGIFGYDTPTTIEFSTITGNQTHEWGGGGAKFYDDGGDATFTMRNSTVSNNTSAYYGGGLYLALGGASVIENSTVSGNSARQSGGVYAGGSGGVTITQSTITNNAATNPGNEIPVGGVQVRGLSAVGGASAAHAAHAAADKGTSPRPQAAKEASQKRAHGDGVRAQAAIDELDLTGTIVAGNTGEDLGVYTSAMTVNSDHSLLGTLGAGVTVNDLGGTIMSTDPGLLPLGDNGGPTQTHALAVGSPAKDAGESPVATFPGNEFDQRGDGYARVVDGTVDIGAYEVQAPQPIDIAPKFTG